VVLMSSVEGAAVATADERKERDRRVVSLYTEPVSGTNRVRSVRLVASMVGLSPARVREILNTAGVIRRRGDPGTRPGPRPDPDAVSRRSAIPYRPHPEIREMMDAYAEEHNMSLQDVVDQAVRGLLAN
jgi:hypothetical protein